MEYQVPKITSVPDATRTVSAALLLHAWSLLPIEALDVRSRKPAKLVDADVYVCVRAPNATNHVVASRMRMYAVKRASEP